MCIMLGWTPCDITWSFCQSRVTVPLTVTVTQFAVLHGFKLAVRYLHQVAEVDHNSTD